MTKRRRTILLTLEITLPLAIFTGLKMGRIFTQADTAHYLALAQGRPAMLPFASRQLAPLIVNGLTRLHLPLHTAFYVEGVAALLLFAGFIGFILDRSGAPLWMVPATLGLFFWPQQFNALAFPDLLYAALLSCFLLLIDRARWLLAALMFFPLMLTRESTLLALACFLIAGRGTLSRRETITAIAAACAGFASVMALTRDALPNQEHLSTSLYLLAKLPWNFLKNILGISPWSNVYPACVVPKWQSSFHVGPVQAVGFCGFDLTYPIKGFAFALASFGLLPLILFKLRPFLRSSPSKALLFRFCLLYGSVSFLLSPLLGELFAHLYSYAWPLFLVALPILLAGTRFTSTRAATLFVTLHLALSWTEIYLYPSEILLVSAVIYPLGYLILRRTFETPANTHESTPIYAAEML